MVDKFDPSKFDKEKIQELLGQFDGVDIEPLTTDFIGRFKTALDTADGNIEKDPLSENLSRYLDQYDAELREQYGNQYEERLSNMELLLQGLPIAHSTNVAHIDDILQSGLKPFAYRGEKNYAKSAIFEHDHQHGLDNYVFAHIGSCPSYGSDKGRVTILINDTVSEQGGFFTFHDLTGILLASEQNMQKEGRYTPDPYADRIKKQFNQEKLPLKYIYKILARTFLKHRKTVDDFFKSKYPTFPPAYDPDFQNTNGGSPELKISGIVSPKHFLGYVVWSDEVRKQLIEKGVPEEKIILSTDPDGEKREIYDYKRKTQLDDKSS